MLSAPVTAGLAIRDLHQVIASSSAADRVARCWREAISAQRLLGSGGACCNVSNTAVFDAGFLRAAGAPVIRRVLRGFPFDQTVAFTREMLGAVPSCTNSRRASMFPDSNRRAMS